MHTTITTTITTTFDLDELEVTRNEVSVQCGDGLPDVMVYAAAAGACLSARQAALAAIGRDDEDDD